MTIDQAFADWFDSASNETAEGSLVRHWALLAYREATERAAKVCESVPPPLKREGGRIEIGERACNAFADAIRNGA